jgi:hypothetical protein
MFQPERPYTIEKKHIRLDDFYINRQLYTIRPPYQRKNVWKKSKKQALLDSLFRKYYIPRIVIREVKIGPERVKNEIVDGQQRILTVQEFFDDEIRLPDSLSGFSKQYTLEGKKFSELHEDIKVYFRNLYYEADTIIGIRDPKNAKHQKVATEIFRRLQEGEPLNYMEKAHARLASIARNFLTFHADEISFDYEKYEPKDNNANRHKFFEIIERSNERLEHLALLARFLLIELADGPTDIGQKEVEEFIKKHENEHGIGKHEFNKNPEKKASKRTLSVISTFYDIFKDDITIGENSGVRELNVEYFIISMYMLLSHINKYYVVDDEMKVKFKEFLLEFYQSYKNDEEDTDIILFRDKRQQDQQSLETRDKITRQKIFIFYPTAKWKDNRRNFNEAERIKIYRRDKGLCQLCLSEGLSEEDAKVDWSMYQADHIFAHSKSGKTKLENAQVLCRKHNAMKSNKSL